MKSPAKAGNDAVETGRQIMDIRLDKDALAADDAMTMIRAWPLDRAKAISGLINEEALASERLGRLTDKAAAAMLDANLFSIRLPKPEGGLGGTGVELFEATEEIARADGSAGWCMLISNTGSTFVHIGVAVEAGFRVSGDFSFASSSSLARWVVVAGPLADRDGQQWFRAHLLPKEDVEIKEGSWDVMGLRATASIDYVIADKFVPAHRTFEYPFLPDGNPQHASAVGLLDLGRPGVAAFASGIGLRALDELIAAAPKTKRLLAEGMQSDDHVVQFGIGELEGRLRAARRYYLDLVAAQDDDIARGRELDRDRRLDMMQALQTLTRAARDMTVFAFDNAGTTVVYATNPLQRCLRDIFTGLKHAVVTPAILGRIGKVRLGLDYGEVRL